MTGEVAHHLAAAGRMADMDGIFQIEVLSDRSQIVRIVIHVVTISNLSRSAVATPVMRNDAIPTL